MLKIHDVSQIKQKLIESTWWSLRCLLQDVALTELGDEINTLTKQVEDLTSALDVKEKENKNLAGAAKRTARFVL